MEDPESEWKIQEYSSSSSTKEDDEDDNKPTVVRRILSSGYVIGKEFVITGIFISSAPLVVPPLVVVSAVGFVFTVPFGVLFASYACTNKIMSMLLPAPVPLPLRLGYYCTDVVETNEDDYGEEVEGYNVAEKEDNELVEQLESGVDGYRQLDDYCVEVEGYVTDKDDNEVAEDVNEEVETEIVSELGDDSRREGETSVANVDEREMEMEMEDDMLQRGINGTEEKEREQMEDVEQGVEMGSSFDVVGDGDQGYEEDAGEYLEGDDGCLEEERKGEERLVKNWDDESESGTHGVNGNAMLMDENRVDNTVEDGCIVSESASGVVFGDVKDVGTTIPVTSESASDVVFGDVKDVGTTVPVTDIESEKLAEVGSKNVEQIGEIRHVVILSDVDVDEMEMEVEDDMLQRENVTVEKEREQVEDVIGVEMSLSFDVAGDDAQGFDEDAGEYLEGGEDGLEEELKGEKLLVNDRQEVNEDTKVMDVGRVQNTVEDNCIVNEGAYNVVFEDVQDVETTKTVTSESASNVVFGVVKVVETTQPVTSESASNVVFGGKKDVETTKPVTNESASNVGFGDAKDAETDKPVTSVSASNVVVGDVETTKPVTSGSSSNVVFGDDEDVETTEPVTVIQIESEKLVEKGSKNDEPVGEMRHVVILSDGNDENNFNSRVVDELDLVARDVIGDAKEDERNIESDEKVPRENTGTHENNGGDAYKDGSEDAIMITMEEHLIHSNADAREIGDEKLLDERNTNYNLEVGNQVKENAADDNVDVLVCAPSKRNTGNGNEVKENAADDNLKRDTDNGNEVKENTAIDNVNSDTENGNEVKENAADDNSNEVQKNAADDNVDVLGRTPSKHDTDKAKVVYKKMPSREENLDDEKIWEKIAAMRTIVGYKAPTQPTCIGELKALYVFTGVEPPASFDGDSDLDAKLKFLMAIVGVK